MTSKILLEQYMAERHALGFSLKTDEGCIRRFLRDFAEPDDGVISFTKEYVLNHIGNRLNVQTNTILRDVSAINGFLDFVIRKDILHTKSHLNLFQKKTVILEPIFLRTMKLSKC